MDKDRFKSLNYQSFCIFGRKKSSKVPFIFFNFCQFSCLSFKKLSSKLSIIISEHKHCSELSNSLWASEMAERLKIVYCNNLCVHLARIADSEKFFQALLLFVLLCPFSRLPNQSTFCSSLNLNKEFFIFTKDFLISALRIWSITS